MWAWLSKLMNMTNSSIVYHLIPIASIKGHQERVRCRWLWALRSYWCLGSCFCFLFPWYLLNLDILPRVLMMLWLLSYEVRSLTFNWSLNFFRDISRSLPIGSVLCDVFKWMRPFSVIAVSWHDEMFLSLQSIADRFLCSAINYQKWIVDFGLAKRLEGDELLILRTCLTVWVLFSKLRVRSYIAINVQEIRYDIGCFSFHLSFCHGKILIWFTGQMWGFFETIWCWCLLAIVECSLRWSMWIFCMWHLTDRRASSQSKLVFLLAIHGCESKT